jgi:hypothetical protein
MVLRLSLPNLTRFGWSREKTGIFKKKLFSSNSASIVQTVPFCSRIVVTEPSTGAFKPSALATFYPLVSKLNPSNLITLFGYKIFQKGMKPFEPGLSFGSFKGSN